MLTYGFNVEGLEDAWRAAIGAQPRTASPDGQATAQPTPTFVPTIVPVGGVPFVQQVTPTVIPTSSFVESPIEIPSRAGPPLALTLILLALCCGFLFLIGVVVLGFVIRSQNRKGGNNVQ
jgi:hypothetical protein